MGDPAESPSGPGRAVDAVIFDWGGTLTPWHAIDLREQWRAYGAVYDPLHADELAVRLLEAEDACWRAGRQHLRAATLDEVFRGVGIDPRSPRHLAALAAYHQFWLPHTHADPDAVATLTELRARGIAVGVLSNTLWTRAYHEEVFERDGLLELIDAAEYSSELGLVKPHPESFLTVMRALGVRQPSQTVFVGDRPYEDIHGAREVGMRAVLVPHSTIPVDQRGHVEGEPDAVVDRLGDLVALIDGWNR